MGSVRYIVTWSIPTFSRVLKELPLDIKHYRLRWDALNEKQQSEVAALLENRPHPVRPLGMDDVVVTVGFQRPRDHTPMLAYRQFFEPYGPKDLDNAIIGSGPDAPLRFLSVYVPDYHEDETGKPITVQEILSCVAGYDVLIMGDVRSVQRLGIVPPKDTSKWTTEDAAIIDQFLCVTDQILRSQWLRHDIAVTTRTHSAQPGGVEHVLMPIGDPTRAVIPLFRQLYSGYKNDRLFDRACTAYCRFCSNPNKSTWVKYEQDSFNKLLKGPVPLSSLGCTVLELLDMVCYGARILHSQPSDMDCEQQLLAAIHQFGREQVQLFFNGSLRHLLQPVWHVRDAIKADYEAWIKTGGLAAPTKADPGTF